jgi:hypothetical protein
MILKKISIKKSYTKTKHNRAVYCFEDLDDKNMNNNKNFGNRMLMSVLFLLVILLSFSVHSVYAVKLQSELKDTNIILSLDDSKFNGVDLGENYELMMSLGNQNYKYFGGMIFPIIINTNGEGLYSFKLLNKSNQEILSEISVSKTFDCDKLSLNVAPSTKSSNNDVGTYSVGEEISIHLFEGQIALSNIPQFIIISIIAQNNSDKVYRLSGDITSKFIPSESGTYTVSLYCNSGAIYSKDIVVKSSDASSDVSMGNVSIIEPYTQNNDLVHSNIENNGANYSIKRITVKNSRNEVFIGDVKAYNIRSEAPVGIRQKILSLLSSNSGKEIIGKIEMDLNGVSGLENTKLSLNDVDSTSNTVLIESISKKNIEEKNTINLEGSIEGSIVDAYALDLSALSFTNGTLTKTAKGRVLWKCKDWNFAQQTCFGKWIEVMNIRPGEDYSFEVSPNDPGFIETGLATINTDKSIYQIGESAKISAVVLDTQGYLVSNATVNIMITTPGNTVYFFDNVAESKRGIYEIIFNHNDIIGNYTMQVSAYKNETNLGMTQYVNYSMISDFSVMEYYDFDIIRNIPITTDPFRKPLYAKILIHPLNENITNYNFTEVIPSDLLVIDAPGATISNAGNETHLTWTGLNGNVTLNYTTQPPLITPNLLILGKAFIEYVINSATYIFVEFRNWFIAVDPTVTRDQGLVVYADRTDDGFIKYRNWTGSTLQSEVNSGVDFGNRIAWLKFRCLVNREQCILVGSDTGADINFNVFYTNNWTWSTNTQLDGSSETSQSNIDLDCESLSGQCIVVYEDSTNNDAVFVYRIWNGTDISGINTVTITGGENNEIDWINLYPQKGTNNIGIAIQNDGGGVNTDTPAIYSAIWNGTNFTNWRTLTANSPADGTSRTFYRHYDCAWEGGTGYFGCFYANDTLNAILFDRFNGTNWNYMGRIFNTSGEPREISACGQEGLSSFNHSYIGLMFCDSANDLDGTIWNGTSLLKTTHAASPAQNTNAECGDSNKGATEYAQNFKCTWEDDGSKALFVWVNNGVTYLTSGSYTKATSTFSNPNWTSGTQIVANGAGALRSAYLVSNPASNSVFLTYTDGARDGGCSLWTGTTWDGSGCNSATVFETTGPNVGVAWLVFDWFRNPPPQPEITIITPTNSIGYINYTGITNPSSTSIAWDNGTTALPPPGASAPITGVEFPSAEYVKITSSNDIRHITTVTGTAGRYAYQSFNFTVTESTVNMQSIIVTHEGYATQTTSLTASQFYIYGYNWSSDSYVLLKTVFASSVDVTSEVTIDAGFNDFVRNRQMYVLVQGSFAIGVGANARADINTDYMGLTVETIPMLSQNITVNASAIDDDGISKCEWIFYNSTNGNPNSLIGMINTFGDYYYNFSSISGVPDGYYNLTVFCNDTLSARTNESVYVYIDSTPPAIILYNPTNNSNITVNYALFSWNATDILYANLVCNLTIDGTVRATNVVSAHAENISRNITSITDGTHYWNVTCRDDAGNRNISQTWRFDSDTIGPAVTLNSPSASSYTNKNPLDLNFTATDSHTIVNCSLYLDGSLNQTITSVTSGIMTNFTFTNLNQGVHNWNVSCYDSFGLRGNSTSRNFTYDTILPTVYLNISTGYIFNGTIPILNYTVIDNIDSNLTCNITVNSVIELANIASTNNTLISRSVPLLDGFKQWNVTCVDDAGNVNTSETRIFQVIGGPLVTLQTPVNGTIGNGTNITLKYYAQDGNGVANCSLYINDVLNQTNTSITSGANNTFLISSLNEGRYNWSVTCYDTNGYPGYSSTWQIISDRSKPSINLSAPISGQVLTTTPTYFNFTLLDFYSTNATCNLTIDGIVNAGNQNFVALNGSVTTRSQTVTNGLHYWNVTCIDLGYNFNTSLTRNFTINVTFPVSVTVVADKTQYQEGEIAQINITTKNETSGNIATNITLDYIYTNNTYTDIPWWNTSWNYRKSIVLNQTNNTLISSKAILVNVTVPYGTITNCHELRVVSDSDLSFVDSNVITGDDVTFCYIYFIGTVTANAVNENNYHVYYGNVNASYSTQSVYVSGNYILEQLFYDDFSTASITSNWTVSSGWDASNANPLAGDHAHIQGTVTDATIRLTNSLNLLNYDFVNLSFTWGIDASWDAGAPLDYLRYDYSNDSASTWTGSGGVGTLNGNGVAQTQTVNTQLNSSYKINGFNLRFRATTNNANEDGGFDTFNITGQYAVQSSVNSNVGNHQVWILRTTNVTNSSGQYNTTFTTLGRTYGNYSAVGYAYPPNVNLRQGWGYDYFDLIADQFGPVITLLYPTNATTLRSGNITFNYTAVDYANNVANCSLYINGVFNQSNSTINESITNNFTSELFEGQYYWLINCFDSLGSQTNSSRYNLTIDDTPPIVSLISPNNSVLPSGTITFNFNVTDNFDTTILCNITVDSGNYSKLFNTSNGVNSTTIANITDGLHYWNMTCYDNINNNATSTTLNFTTATIPIVTLHSPATNYGVNSTNITLYYNLSSVNVDNCSLVLNGQYNQTVNSTQIPFKANDGQNVFNLTGMGYGIYNWTVICFDSNNFNGTDTTRIFHLDNAFPIINLSYPANNQTIFSRNINFTFNVTDIDDVLVCNLTIDGVVNKSNQNISSNNSGKVGSIYVTGLSVTNHNWSVACADNVGFSTTSVTWNFTIDSSVSISLTSPANNFLSSSGSVNFIYVPSSPADFDLGFCDLYINDSIYATHVALTSGSPDTFAVAGLGEGRYNWSINCTDSVGKNGASETRNFTLDMTGPIVTNYYPNGNVFTNSSVFFNWSATDNYDANMSCTILVNGTAQSPIVYSLNGTVTNHTYSNFRDGLLFWNVTCTDDAGNNGTSSLKNFTVQEPPAITLNSPSNNNRTKNRNITFYYTPTDNSGNISSCSIIFDGLLNQTNSTQLASGVQRNFTINNIAAGNHTWSINCTDPSGNIGSSINYTFYIDLYAPTIVLDRPIEGDFLNTNDVFFNWTATDYSGTTINCSLYVDNLFKNSTARTSGSSFNITAYNLTDGPHNWSVNCSDDLANYLMSETRNFTINQPDLYIDNNRIIFNNTNPDENSTINITVNVTNIGGVPANNILVEFWDGLPNVGTYIGNDTGTVAVNGSRIYSVLWNITLGYHNIWVIVDPYNTQGELNESNNNATKNISILRSIINSPLNGTASINSNVTINFTLQDFTTGNINYSVFVDGSFNGQNGSVVDNVSTLLNVTLTQGLHYIQIQARDLLGRYKNSTRVYITIDYTAPQPVINTVNYTWYNYSIPQINISATDNVYTNISYRVYVNGTENINGTITNGTSKFVNLSTLSDGYYVLIMEAWDFLNNTANSTPKYIYVDTTKPTITLNSPGNNANITNRTVQLNFTVNDNLANNATCNITLDGLIVSFPTVNISQPYIYTANNLIEGTHYWNVTCMDQALNINTSVTNSFNVYIAPNITLVSPSNNQWSNTANNTFYFNVSDETGLENCSIILNGVINQTKTTAQLVNNGTNNFTITEMISGNHTWSIECYDNTLYHTYSISSNRTLYVDLIRPQPNIETLNNSWFNTATPLITFNITDNMALTINYTLFVNGSGNTNGVVTNGSTISVNLQPLQNGTYSVILQGTDLAGNVQNSTPIIIYIDTILPSINLTYPANDTNITASYTNLNFTPSDNMASYLMCNVTLDGNNVGLNINVTNGQNQNVSVSSINGGYHYWNVTCMDQAGNKNTSQTFRFYIQMPDLYINTSSIYFSNNNPIENETINITATIYNIGNIDAFNFIAEIRAINQTGPIVANVTLNLSAGNYTNITGSYMLPIGDTSFYVLVDTPITTNGSVQEENESNNNASKTIHVGLWEYVVGTTIDKLALINNLSIYDWIVNNATGSNLYVTDADSNINWFTLQALGRNISNGTSGTDFYTFDTKINSTILTDSVNRTYTLGGQPIETINYTVFRRFITNIPIVNSTNNTNFKTGLLWDTGDGGIAYNGTQDVVLISKISKSTQGYNATVDYELRVPATLRSYKGSVNQVVFYGEIN